MLQFYVLTCGRSVTTFLVPPRSQRPEQGPRSLHPKAGTDCFSIIKTNNRFILCKETCPSVGRSTSNVLGINEQIFNQNLHVVLRYRCCLNSRDVVNVCATCFDIRQALHTTLLMYRAGPRGRAVWGVGLWPPACWDYGFESLRWHGCISVVGVVCCQVEVSATGRSLVLRSPTECGVSECDQVQQ
jgi:hypothetical protein